MPWYLIVPIVAGGLFLLFAAVEWSLARAETDRESRHRIFLAGGAACMLACGLLYILWQQQTQAASLRRDTQASANAGPLSALDNRLRTPLDLVEQLLAAKPATTLKDVLRVRATLLDARRQLAVAEEEPSLAVLYNQTDRLLGVAYYTAGAQWRLAKEQRNGEAERQEAVRQLRGEYDRWKELRDCLAQGKDLCVKEKQLTPKEATLEQFNRWMHLYSVELLRFSETDWELVDSSAGERKRLATVLAQGRRDLAARSVEEWERPAAEAADHLLMLAEEALTKEGALISQGQWGSEWQHRVYEPVQLAMERYFSALTCSAGQKLIPCSPSGKGTAN